MTVQFINDMQSMSYDCYLHVIQSSGLSRNVIRLNCSSSTIRQSPSLAADALAVAGLASDCLVSRTPAVAGRRCTMGRGTVMFRGFLKWVPAGNFNTTKGLAVRRSSHSTGARVRRSDTRLVSRVFT